MYSPKMVARFATDCFIKSTPNVVNSMKSRAILLPKAECPKSYFEITTLPKSSILRTIPVAFIYTFLLKLQIVLLLSVFLGEIYRKIYF